MLDLSLSVAIKKGRRSPERPKKGWIHLVYNSAAFCIHARHSAANSNRPRSLRKGAGYIGQETCYGKDCFAQFARFMPLALKSRPKNLSARLPVCLMTVSPPRRAIPAHPIHQSLLETNVMPQLFALQPLMLHDLLAFSDELAVETRLLDPLCRRPFFCFLTLIFLYHEIIIRSLEHNTWANVIYTNRTPTSWQRPAGVRLATSGCSRD